MGRALFLCSKMQRLQVQYAENINVIAALASIVDNKIHVRVLEASYDLKLFIICSLMFVDDTEERLFGT